MSATERARLTLEFSPQVAALMDHISDITGVPKTQIVQGALLDALPELLERADKLRRRGQELSQGKKK